MKIIKGQYLNGNPYEVHVENEDYADYLIARVNSTDNGSLLDIDSLVETDTDNITVIPDMVSAVQLKQSLYHFGLFYQIDAYLKELNGEIWIWWNNYPTFNRNDERLITASQQLNDAGITNDLDEIFIYANTLE